MNDLDNDRKKQLHDDKKWQRVIQSFYETLDMLGEPSKNSLLNVLEHEYNISFSKDRCSPPEQIESALRNIFGPGAEFLIRKWKEKMSL